MPQHIIVTEYNPEWETEFKKEADLIAKILGSLCIDIFHIGSTAVPGLKAKPIIDIMPVVHNIDKVDALAKEFEKVGYEYLGEFGIKGRRYLRRAEMSAPIKSIFLKKTTPKILNYILLCVITCVPIPKMPVYTEN